MKLNDIIALARAGYKIADIKAMEEQEKIVEEEKPTIEQPTKAEEDKPEEKVMDNKTLDEWEDAEDDNATTTDAIDYKAEYENLLKKVQQKNINKDVSGNEKTDNEILEDIVRSFM